MGAPETIDTTIPPAAEALAAETGKLLESAKDFKVATVEQAELAGIELKRVADMERRVEEERKKMKAPILAAGKAVDAFFAKPLEALATAKATFKRALLAYQDEQERIRRAEEARIRELQRQEQERLAREAEEAERAGRKEEAEAIIQQAAEMPAAIVPPAPAPRVAGVATRTTWGAEVTDIKALCAAVAAGTVPPVAVQANMTFLRQQAVSLKEAFAIPGVKAVATKGMAA